MVRSLRSNRVVSTGSPDHRIIALPSTRTSDYLGLLVNGNYPYPVCSTNGRWWIDMGPGAPRTPSDCGSGGLTGHMVGSNNGNFYRGHEDVMVGGTRSTGAWMGDWTEHASDRVLGHR